MLFSASCKKCISPCDHRKKEACLFTRVLGNYQKALRDNNFLRSPRHFRSLKDWKIAVSESTEYESSVIVCIPYAIVIFFQMTVYLSVYNLWAWHKFFEEPKNVVYYQHGYFSYMPQERKYYTQMSSVCCPEHQLLQLSHSNAFWSSPSDLPSAGVQSKMRKWLITYF